MTVDEVKKMREYVERTTVKGGRTYALAVIYEDVLDEIAHNPNADARALARAAIGADDAHLR